MQYTNECLQLCVAALVNDDENNRNKIIYFF